MNDKDINFKTNHEYYYWNLTFQSWKEELVQKNGKTDRAVRVNIILNIGI